MKIGMLSGVLRRTGAVLGLICVGVILANVTPAFADEPGPNAFPRVHKKVAPPPVAPPVVMREEPAAVVETDPCEWGTRLGLGMTVWFFQDEGNLPAPAAYGDIFNNCQQINFRMGVEGRHMYLSQDAAQFARTAPDVATRITYIRIPFAVEYIVPVDENITQLFLGGGPDIIHTANDIGETGVGMHLGARLLHNFDERWGAAIEGGYMWARVDGEGSDISLDGAYITPTLTYTF